MDYFVIGYYRFDSCTLYKDNPVGQNVKRVVAPGVFSTVSRVPTLTKPNETNETN